MKCFLFKFDIQFFCLLFQVAKVSSNVPFVENWRTNAEAIVTVQLINITEINVNIADSKNAWNQEWDQKVKQNS